MGHIQKILVPMDGSPASIAALTQALTLAEDLGSEVDVLHVATGDEEEERDFATAVDDARQWLGDRLTSRTEHGDPIRVILDTARARDVDLIVMGTHGRIGRLHELLGSVAESVVRNASCPVMTVRRPDGEEESFAERIHHREPVGKQTPPLR